MGKGGGWVGNIQQGGAAISVMAPCVVIKYGPSHTSHTSHTSHRMRWAIEGQIVLHRNPHKDKSGDAIHPHAYVTIPCTAPLYRTPVTMPEDKGLKLSHLRRQASNSPPFAADAPRPQPVPAPPLPEDRR